MRFNSTASFWKEGSQKILWALLLLSFGGLVLINAIWFFPILNDVEANVVKVRLGAARRIADIAEDLIDHRKRALERAAEEIAAAESQSRDVLERLLADDEDMISASLLTESLREYMRVDRFNASPGRDYSMLRVAENIADDGVYFGSIFRSENFEPYTYIAVPVSFGGGDRKVFLLAELNLSFLSELTERRFFESGKAFIVDDHGFIIVHPDVQSTSERLVFGEATIVQKIFFDEGMVEAFRYINEQGIAVEASGIKMQYLPWGLVAVQDVFEVNILRNRIIGLVVLSFFIGLCLLGLLLYNLFRYVELNRMLREYLKENQISAKMLVQRDLELSEANERLMDLDMVKSEFVSVAAHQMRTPLTGIRWSYIALLEQETGSLNQEQRLIIEEGLGATTRAIDLVNDLLNVARIEEGRFGFTPKRQAVLPLIEKTKEHFMRGARDKGIALTIEVPASGLPELMLDGEKISMLLDILVDNAIKYTAPGGAVTMRISQQKSAIQIDIEDTGVGIPGDQQGRVFTKFFRANNALLLQTSGTGLGLYVAKNIAERHGGTLWFESVENKGSKFHFTIPLESEGKEK